MKGAKNWWLSKGMIGGLASVILWIGSAIFNLDMDKATTEEILTHIVGPIVAIWGVWGRAVATEKIKWRN